MRHVLATIAVLLIALAGFHYWNGQQASAFEAAAKQAEALASQGDLSAAIDALDQADTRRMSPGLRSKAVAKRRQFRERLVDQADTIFREQLSAGQLDLAEMTLDELEAHLPPDQVREQRQELDRHRQKLERLDAALPDFSNEVTKHWRGVADALASWNATIRNPLTKHRERVEKLIWNASTLSSLREKQAQEEQKLVGLQDDIADWRSALPNAPERSLNPFSTSRKNLEKKIADAEEKRAEAQAAWETQQTQIRDTLKRWFVPEPDRIRTEDELRALHRIVALPQWLAACTEKLPEQKAVEAQQKLLECLRSALQYFPEAANLKTDMNSAEDPVGLSEAVRAELVDAGKSRFNEF